MKKQMLFIINPVSGTRKFLKKRLPRIIKRIIDTERFEYQIRYTQYKGHAVVLAKTAIKESIEIIVMAGGDGSINEVANVIKSSNVILGIIPVGSGNGLARHLGYTMNAQRTIKAINKLKIGKIDICSYDKRIFCSNAGLGFDALVIRLFDTSRNRGFFGYAFSVLKGLIMFPGIQYEIKVNNQVLKGKAFLISACNSNQVGYNVKLAPYASLQDGLMDLWILDKFPRWKAPFLFLRVLRKTHFKSPYFKNYISKQIEIKTTEKQYFQVDGEARNPVDYLNICVIPKALEVIIPS